MFAKAVDFNKHIGRVKQLEKFITTHPSELLEVLDIIFKYKQCFSERTKNQNNCVVSHDKC